jgi:uncharacterized protein
MLSECIDLAELQALAVATERRQLRVDSAAVSDRFKRLTESVAARRVSEDDSPGFVVDLCFENGAEGYPCVNIDLVGRIDLECQRCLKPFGFSLHLESRLTILTSDEQSRQIAEPFDAVIMASDGLDMLTIIEDEILSALPIAPMHESAADCVVFDGVVPVITERAGVPHRPFANLSALMEESGKE